MVRRYLKRQFFANAVASFVLQSALGVSFIVSHHASLPTSGEHARDRKTSDMNKKSVKERFFFDLAILTHGKIQLLRSSARPGGQLQRGIGAARRRRIWHRFGWNLPLRQRRWCADQ